MLACDLCTLSFYMYIYEWFLSEFKYDSLVILHIYDSLVQLIS